MSWFYETSSVEFAETLVSELNRRRGLDYQKHMPEFHLNPRFTFVSAEGLPDGQQAIIRRCINDIRRDVEPALPHAKATLLLGCRAIQVTKELSQSWPDEAGLPLESPQEPIPTEPKHTRRKHGSNGSGGNGRKKSEGGRHEKYPGLGDLIIEQDKLGIPDERIAAIYRQRYSRLPNSKNVDATVVKDKRKNMKRKK